MPSSGRRSKSKEKTKTQTKTNECVYLQGGGGGGGGEHVQAEHYTCTIDDCQFGQRVSTEEYRFFFKDAL